MEYANMFLATTDTCSTSRSCEMGTAPGFISTLKYYPSKVKDEIFSDLGGSNNHKHSILVRLTIPSPPPNPSHTASKHWD